MFLPTRVILKQLQLLEHEGRRQEIDGHDGNVNKSYKSGAENV